MQSLISELASPRWWVSVVVVGLAINLVSSYIKPPIDAGFRKIAAWRRSQSEKAAAVWQRRVGDVAGSDRALILEAAKEQRERTACMFAILIAIVAALLAIIIGLSGGSKVVVSLFYGAVLYSMLEAARYYTAGLSTHEIIRTGELARLAGQIKTDTDALMKLAADRPTN